MTFCNSKNHMIRTSCSLMSEKFLKLYDSLPDDICNTICSFVGVETHPVAKLLIPRFQNLRYIRIRMGMKYYLTPESIIYHYEIRDTIKSDFFKFSREDYVFEPYRFLNHHPILCGENLDVLCTCNFIYRKKGLKRHLVGKFHKAKLDYEMKIRRDSELACKNFLFKVLNI
jgi:hypothetical protein